MRLHLGRQLLLAFWREILAISAGAGATTLLWVRQQPGFALAALAASAAGTAWLGLLTWRGGHLRRALAWPRLRQLTGLDVAALAREPLRPIADSAEEVLAAIALAPRAVRAYLSPAVEETRTVLLRSSRLAEGAARHRREIAALEREHLEEAARERRARCDDATDPELRRELGASLAAIEVQTAALHARRRALGLIDSELDAARRTLHTVAAQIEEASFEIAVSVEAAPRALPARRLLEDRVTALSKAIHETLATTEGES